MGAIRKTYFLIRCMMLFLLFIFPSMVSAADAKKTVETHIPVYCNADNIESAFAYTLSSESTENQNVKCGKLTLKDGEKGVFTVEYTYPGTYHYEVRQTKGNDEQISYDDTVYAVDVYVTEDENGKMSAEPVAYVQDHDEKKESLDFVNKRTVPVLDTGSGNNGSGDSGRKNNGSGDNGKQDVIKASVKTGDDTRLGGYLILFYIAFTAVLFLMLGKRAKSGSGGCTWII